MDSKIYNTMFGILLIGSATFDSFDDPVDWKYHQLDKTREIASQGTDPARAVFFANHYRQLVDRIFSDRMLFAKDIRRATYENLIDWFEENLHVKSLEDRLAKARLELKVTELFSDDPEELSRANTKVQKIARKLKKREVYDKK